MIDDGQLLDLVFLQYARSCLHVGGLIGSDEIVLGHDLVDAFEHILLEAQVTVGHDAHEIILVVHHRYAADAVFGHQAERILDRRAALDGHGVIYHPVFSPLDYRHLACLLVDRHILVNHSDATLARDGNSHLRLGHGVHGGGDKRDFQLDVARELGRQIDLARQNVRIGRD